MSITKVKTKKFKSGEGYKLDFHRRGMKRVREVFESRALAQAVADKLAGDAVRREHGLPVDSGIKLEDLIAHHLKMMRKRGREHDNTKRAETTLNRFAELVGPDTLVEKIRRSDLRRYVEIRLAYKPKPPKRAVGNSSINREVTEIRSCLQKATTYYAALEDWQPPKGTWLEEPTDGRRQTWDPDSEKKVLAELLAPPRDKENGFHLRARRIVAEIFLIVRRTGMRPGEVRKLRKSQIDFRNRLVIVTSKKGMSEKRTARSREIPIPDDVFEIIERRAREAKAEYLFTGNTPDKPFGAYHRTLKLACERAKVPFGYNGLTMYDARRTAENEMLEAGHSPRAVGDIFGHSAETMAKHYARSTREQRRQAVESTRVDVHTLSTPTPEMPDLPDLPAREERKKAASGD